MAGQDYSNAPTKHVDPSAATTPDSSTRQPTTSKEDLKDASKEDKNLVIAKKEVFITASTGDSPKSPNLSYSNRVADYYRNGRENLDGSLAEYPRSADPFDVGVDGTTASIRVFGKPKGKTETMDLIPAYTKFILDGVQESHTERSQIIETFGDFYVFMFGQRPPVYNFTGTLINAKNASWVTDFMYMYEMWLRGTRCVENNAIVIITYGGRQIEGLILSTANQTMAASEMGVPFQFSVVVFERRYYNFSPDMGFSLDDKNVLSQDDNFIKMLEKTAGKEGKGTSNTNTSTAHGAADAVVGKGKPAAGTV